MHAQNVDCDCNAGNLEGFIDIERMRHFYFPVDLSIRKQNMPLVQL